MKNYDSRLAHEIPEEITVMAKKIERFFDEKGIKDWKLGGLQKRVSDPLIAMWQEYDGDHFDVRTHIDINTLDPYQLLFLWTTFHQRMSQHMLKACGCEDKHLPDNRD